MAHKTLSDIAAHKNQPAPLVCLTAYTASIASIIAPHVDLILVGDSLGMTLYGMSSTREVTLEMMINHGRAVMRRNGDTFVVVDMPFGTYEDSPPQALSSAQRIMTETGAHAVKLEGGVSMAPAIQTLTENNIPVMAHIGLTPQSVADGKFRVKGKSDDQIARLHADAKAVETAGAFAVVIEGTIEPVAAALTKILTIPTIGIGASATCDGQILVTEDMLGLLDGHTPKFVKHYAHMRDDIEGAVQTYASEVRARAFPGDAHIYHAPAEDAPRTKKSA